MSKSAPEAKNIFVVGGGGYIGSQAVLDLKKAGYKPIIIDNFSTGNRDIAQTLGVEIFEGNVGSESFLSEVFSKHTAAAVMHFAAFAYVGESVTDPAKYYRNNVSNTLTLLQKMRDHKLDRFIFSSTCATYGVPASVPITETTPQNPINPYGRTKLIVEGMLQDFAAAYGLQFVAFRYFNAAGADPAGQIGEKHDPESHLIPLAINAALKNGNLSVFGSDYPTFDGTCIRDYIHVSDIAEAHILGMKYLIEGGKSDFFNIGNGTGFSVLEVIKTIEKVSGKKVPYTVSARREGDPPALVAAADKIRNVLQWKPAFPDLVNIVETAWNWHLKNA